VLYFRSSLTSDTFRAKGMSVDKKFSLVDIIWWCQTIIKWCTLKKCFRFVLLYPYILQWSNRSHKISQELSELMKAEQNLRTFLSYFLCDRIKLEAHFMPLIYSIMKKHVNWLMTKLKTRSYTMRVKMSEES
jgi:hypothetical protein